MLAPVTAAVLIGFALGNLAERDIGANFSQLLSTIEKVALYQSRAFISGSPQVKGATPGQPEKLVPERRESMKRERPLAQDEDYESLLLDKQASLVKLFRLFKLTGSQGGAGGDDVYPGLFSLETSEGLYREMQHPFRVRIRKAGPDTPVYLLVTEVTPDGVLVPDKKGATRIVPHEYVLSNWDGEISWVYPYESGNKQLSEGMTGAQVLRLQEMLRNAGYDVEANGVFDSKTSDAIIAFQEEMNIKPDGIAGTRTKALLYQVAG